ncbi:MAG TPA: hypothetical protein VKM54_09245 [Myxococcota bacterium]|nr:hypothetical protein [Myxococcota bacterium]
MDRDELLARAKKPAEDALRLNSVYRGKVQIAPKVPIIGWKETRPKMSPGRSRVR